MLAWSDLFDPDGSPLRSGYMALVPALSHRAATVLDQLSTNPSFSRDAPWAREDGSGLSRTLMREPGCGGTVLAELDAIRRGHDWHAERASQLQDVVVHLSGAEIALVDACRQGVWQGRSRAEFLR